MIRFTMYDESNINEPSPCHMREDAFGNWVPYSVAQDLETENAILRKEVEKYKRINAYMIHDECELEAELEKLGLVFYDDYGHLGIHAVLVDYITSLQKKGIS